MTGVEFSCQNFKLAKTDEEKFGIFDQHPSYFAPIKGELKIWLAANWTRWNRERPAWFTEAAIAFIPNNIVPKEELLKHKDNGGRKDSTTNIAGAVRRLSVTR